MGAFGVIVNWTVTYLQIPIICKPVMNWEFIYVIADRYLNA